MSYYVIGCKNCKLTYNCPCVLHREVQDEYDEVNYFDSDAEDEEISGMDLKTLFESNVAYQEICDFYEDNQDIQCLVCNERHFEIWNVKVQNQPVFKSNDLKKMNYYLEFSYDFLVKNGKKTIAKNSIYYIEIYDLMFNVLSKELLGMKDALWNSFGPHVEKDPDLVLAKLFIADIYFDIESSTFTINDLRVCEYTYDQIISELNEFYLKERTLLVEAIQTKNSTYKLNSYPPIKH